jgi:1-deoxy-D-xylulose-5-phosphate synthase
VLDEIFGPSDLRRLDNDQLTILAAEIRAFLVAKVSRAGGHLGPNLGVVELTMAIHRVFDSPRDRVVFDTGHQAYVHKILTGRAGDFDTLRRAGGLSGYPSRSESDHDVVENSHASTALSYADGLAKAFQLTGVDRHVVAVVGDGALTGGMAWEALNNIAVSPAGRLVVVVNDNGRSYAPTVGGLAQTGKPRRLYESLGLTYLGPVDGHDVASVELALGRAKQSGRPTVVHVLTKKGLGYRPAETHDADRLHAVAAGVDPQTAQPTAASATTWTDVVSAELLALGTERADIVAITAAMLHPTGLDAFAAAFPERTFDVGIAEQHAVTCATGMAMGGLHPVVAVYATFLNRAFDQVLMDAALHRQPVTIVLDRAGVTGEDGPSHHGMWDMSMLQLVPGLRLAAPRDGARVSELLREAAAVDDAPTVVRVPKGALPPDLPSVSTAGDTDIMMELGPRDVLLVGVGPMVGTCLDVGRRLHAHGIGATVVDPRWVKPVASELVDLAASYRLVVTVEDNGRVGGCGSALSQAVSDAGLSVPVRVFGIPQTFVAQGKRAVLLAEMGLDAQTLAREITGLVSKVSGHHGLGTTAAASTAESKVQ